MYVLLQYNLGTIIISYVPIKLSQQLWPGAVYVVDDYYMLICKSKKYYQKSTII